MKKLFFLVLFLSSLFANTAIMSSLSTMNKSKSEVVVDDDNKLVFITIFYIGDVSLSDKKIEKMKEELVEATCKNKIFRKYIKQKYKYIYEYFFTNNVSLRVIINKCETKI